jgi:outer membrane lipoprotein SlyB
LLGVVTAGLAGALIMRSVDHGAPTFTAQNSAVEVSPALQSNPGSPAVAGDRGAPNAIGAMPAAPRCAQCGVVESVGQVQQKGQGSGLGAVTGGVLGGVVGHQVGRGNGNTAMTVLGAIGGGLAGNEVEKRARSTTHFEVHVRMQDGSLRVFQRAQSLAVGTPVVAQGATLRVAHEASGRDDAHSAQTAAPADAHT